jgi:hypothetical protein
VKNIVIKYAFLQDMLIPYSSQNGFIYLRVLIQHNGASPQHLANFSLNN